MPDVPILVGSGIDESNAEVFLSLADGAIQNPVDRARVKRLASRIKMLL